MAGRREFLGGCLATTSLLVGCTAPRTTDPVDPPTPAIPPQGSAASRTPPASPKPGPRTSTPAPTRTPTPAPRLGSDGTPYRASVSIPSIKVTDLEVEPYRGSPDDAPGTRIQNRGRAASPSGPRGGTGPGGVGNHIITAHRLSSTRAFLDLPKVERGAKVHLVADGRRYTYEIVATRETSFRSKRSLAEQSAPVPGHPGRRATRAMITLSTCATPEDHAEGNYWSDRFDNPEHRIDKIGVLVADEPAD